MVKLAGAEPIGVVEVGGDAGELFTEERPTAQRLKQLLQQQTKVPGWRCWEEAGEQMNRFLGYETHQASMRSPRAWSLDSWITVHNRGLANSGAFRLLLKLLKDEAAAFHNLKVLGCWYADSSVTDVSVFSCFKRSPNRFASPLCSLLIV